ncbi:protein TIFY 5A [Tripterygium wilfordii]|uniref:Protein TIFY 5A n=1 Tax=Tripterygium wilfordii TaxID=458696 RepID=A0A7J7DR93_TRIWF|nr:protein TIFY 5A [Tripterygium wilfordii]
MVLWRQRGSNWTIMRNCSLDLDSSSFQSLNQQQTSTVPEASKAATQKQPIAFFHNGQMNICDITELQARAIIWLAGREMEERIKKTSSRGPKAPSLSQLYSLPGVSMKRSLQRFLQKRNKRTQTTSPYSKH